MLVTRLRGAPRMSPRGEDWRSEPLARVRAPRERCPAPASVTTLRPQRAPPAALLLYSPVPDHTNYIVGAGADTRVALGALLEVLLIIANIGTAVVLFPILKRQNEGLALGYVTARLVESTFIAIGIVSYEV